MPRQPEGKLVAKMQKLLKDRGARCFKIQGDGDNFQEVGIPDLLVCYRGRFLGLEVKLPSNYPSPRQCMVLDEIADAGGIAAVVTTVEQVATLLGKIDKEVDHGKTVPRPVDPYCFHPRSRTKSSTRSRGKP